MTQRMIYHWKHGWIPLDLAAALSKAHGSHAGAAKYLHGDDAKRAAGIGRLQRASNAAAKEHGLPYRYGSRVQVTTLAGGHFGTGTVRGISPDGQFVHVNRDGQNGAEVFHHAAVLPAKAA